MKTYEFLKLSKTMTAEGQWANDEWMLEYVENNQYPTFKIQYPTFKIIKNDLAQIILSAQRVGRNELRAHFQYERPDERFQ